MKIHVPRQIYLAWDTFYNWANVPLFRIGRVQVCRIDPVILIALLGSTGYGYWIGGWVPAATNALVFMLLVMTCLWML